jgi:alkanesulfonate monooxygenase SsuD/methylene tetrahydromethanopterin reductase-like flavin-dependent oxidoreductase (luciferase family)
MRVYHFTEQPYPDAWPHHAGSLRVTLPNRLLDPAVAADLIHRYYDEWALADELGLDVMVNEHHQTATCMSSTSIVALSVLARITKRARLLILGYPIGHRTDPLRVAEELAMVDVISRGRLDMGFIKGVPYEFACSNQNAVGVMDRFWEAHDFIIKAMTSHDGPFNWESENFHYRQVNIWPRPYQQPYPPVWSTTASRGNARVLGERGYVMCVLGSGYATRPVYDAYREGYRAAGRGTAPADRLGYLALVSVAATEQKARERAEIIATYLRSSEIVAPAFKNPPGYLTIEDSARVLKGQTAPRSATKDGRKIDMRRGSVQELIDAAIMFCGTPDQVFEQITDFADHCGGFGHLIMMGQAGTLSHADTIDNLTLFAKEVLPRLKTYRQPALDATAAA